MFDAFRKSYRYLRIRTFSPRYLPPIRHFTRAPIVHEGDFLTNFQPQDLHCVGPTQPTNQRANTDKLMMFFQKSHPPLAKSTAFLHFRTQIIFSTFVSYGSVCSLSFPVKLSTAATAIANKNSFVNPDARRSAFPFLEKRVDQLVPRRNVRSMDQLGRGGRGAVSLEILSRSKIPLKLASYQPLVYFHISRVKSIRSTCWFLFLAAVARFGGLFDRTVSNRPPTTAFSLFSTIP